MARPFAYKKLHQHNNPYMAHHMTTMTSSHMYAIKYQGEYVIICTEPDFPEYNEKGQPTSPRKYKRPFFNTYKPAKTQCDRLNQLFNTDEYQVVKI
tara:strand:+ start:428 stop:715 length:288 start_codon:yes stop_codon:yes gene_type:complete